jgi:ketosteroid isomerase-like protein
VKNRQLPVLAFLAVASLCVCRTSLCASAAADEAAVRKADADWAAAASSGSVDAWTAFYAADAIVRLPNDRLASGKELLRQAVARLLSLPHLSLAWRPIEVDVARSGDLAYVLQAYELRFGDSRGAPVSNRGRRLEIWRRQAGTWKCTVDTWSLDEPTTAPPAAAPPAAAAASSSAGPAAPLAPTEPPAAAAPDSGPPKPARAAPTKYGDMPADYKETIRRYFQERLKSADSIQYREISTPQQGYLTIVSGAVLMSEKREYGWTVKATINAKNSSDSYVGFKSYTFLFRGEKILDVRLPLPGDEMK